MTHLRSNQKKQGFRCSNPVKRRQWRKWQVSRGQRHGLPKAPFFVPWSKLRLDLAKPKRRNPDDWAKAPIPRTASDNRPLRPLVYTDMSARLSGMIRANRFARFARIGWFARIGNLSDSCESAWRTIKNWGFNCEWFARIDSRELRCESPVPLSRAIPQSATLRMKSGVAKVSFVHRGKS